MYSFLFEDNFTALVRKGVEINQLLMSNLFCHQFDLESWPQFHTNNETMIMPYDGSIFDLRSSYERVFPELAEDEQFQQRARQNVNYKVYKIKYTVNLLPQMGEEHIKIMDMLGDIE